MAAGEGIPAAFDAVVARGHAIEVRINAEDPGARFMPAPGTVTGWQRPSAGRPGRRRRAGRLHRPQAYDSLLAKLIVWGEDRDQARRRMLRALDEFQIEGVPTTIPFHRLAMLDPAFTAREVSTVLVEEGMDLSSLEPATMEGGLPTAKPPPRRLVIELEGKRFDVDLFPQGRSGSRSGSAPLAPPRPWRRARAESSGPGKGGRQDPHAGHDRQGAGGGGRHRQGQADPGRPQAMKMENHVTAHQAGTVSGLEVSEGQTVPTEATIAIIEVA